MMLRIVRSGMFALVPAELALILLMVSGVEPPRPVTATVEAVATAVAVMTAVVAVRLFRIERLGGAGRRAAVRTTVDRLVPGKVRRIMAFDLRGVISLGLWVVGRRHGVPPGATAVSYARAQTPTLMVFLAMMMLETVVLDILLRGLGVPAGMRTAALVAGLYSVLFCLAVIAACVTRPHVVSGGALRIRYGAFFDLRVPREQICSVRSMRNCNESGSIKIEDERLTVAVDAQTNVLVELKEPVTAIRPLGRRAQARTICFFADAPEAVLDALTPVAHPPGSPCQASA